MERYDVAIIGLGPAGATLARLLDKKLRVIALDKKRESGDDGFKKPCGGLLAPDAQRAFIRFGLNLPTSVIANPQIFSVKTLDTQTGISRNYQRSYININRHAFDLWMKSLVPNHVDVHHDTLCKRIEQTDDGYCITFTEGVKKSASLRDIWSVLTVLTLWLGASFIPIMKFGAIRLFSSGLKTATPCRFTPACLITKSPTAIPEHQQRRSLYFWRRVSDEGRESAL